MQQHIRWNWLTEPMHSCERASQPILTVAVEVTQCVIEALSTHVAEHLGRRREECDRHAIEIVARQLNARTFTQAQTKPTVTFTGAWHH